MSGSKAKFGTTIDTIAPGCWSIGVCFSHMEDETYLFINLLKWSITIGVFRQEAGKGEAE